MKKFLLLCLLVSTCCCLTAFADSQVNLKAGKIDSREALKLELVSLQEQISAAAAAEDFDAIEPLANRLSELRTELGLNISRGNDRPGNGRLDDGGESCADPTAIPSLPYCDVSTTIGATVDVSPPGCSYGTPDKVYSYTTGEFGEAISISVTGNVDFWPIISLHHGGCGGGSINDDCELGIGGSACTSANILLPNTTYYIVVCGYPLGTFIDGGYTLHVVAGLECYAGPCDPPDPCQIEDVADFCEDAILVDVPSSHIGSTAGMTPEVRPVCITPDGSGGAVWYKVIGNGNTYTATTCNPCTNFDTKLRVYRPCSCDNLDCVAGNDDNCDITGLESTLAWATDPGEEYLILVHGFSDNEGTFALDLSDDGVESGGDNIVPCDFVCTCCNTETSHTADPEPDASIINNSITCVTLNVPVEYLITDVNVCLDLDHTFIGDLDITLQSPAGTIIQLFNRTCQGDDNLFCFTFDDEADGTIDCDLVYQEAQSVIPFEALSAFDGENAAGPWVLCITDNQYGDQGSLHWFCLTFDYDEILPVELANYDAIAGDKSVTLNWTTASETDNDHFDISRDGSLIGRVNANGSTSGGNYHWTEDNLSNGTEYSYIVASVDVNGAAEELFTISATPNLFAASVTEYALLQNYPNPFNPETNIIFDLVESGNVMLSVFNPLGQRVATLVNGSMPEGRHSVSFDAASLPSGLYFYRLEAGDFSAIRKMILMK